MSAPIEAVADDIIELADSLPQVEPDRDALILLLARMERAKKAWQAIRADVERVLLPLLTEETVVDGVIASRTAARRQVKWDNKRLVSLIVARAVEDRVVDEETGEMQDRAEAVEQALVDAYALDTPSKAPRTSWLKQAGLDPDDYRDFTWGSPSVRLTLPDGGRK